MIGIIRPALALAAVAVAVGVLTLGGTTLLSGPPAAATPPPGAPAPAAEVAAFTALDHSLKWTYLPKYKVRAGSDQARGIEANVQVKGASEYVLFQGYVRRSGTFVAGATKMVALQAGGTAAATWALAEVKARKSVMATARFGHAELEVTSQPLKTGDTFVWVEVIWQ